MTSLGLHPNTVRVYDHLRARGSVPLVPREYGLRLVSEVLRADDHVRLLDRKE